MENEIKKLIKKYDSWGGVINEQEGFFLNSKARLEIVTDLNSLLEFKQKNCCGNPQDKSLITAFAQGASWWEWYKEKASMWQSDQLLAEEEAVRRLKGDTLGKTVEEIANETAKDKTK